MMVRIITQNVSCGITIYVYIVSQSESKRNLRNKVEKII